MHGDANLFIEGHQNATISIEKVSKRRKNTMKSWNEIRKTTTAFSKRGKNAYDEKR